MVRMSRKRLAKIAVPVVAALVLVLVGALVAGGWYISDILRTDGLLPDHEEPPLDMVVDLVGDGSVTLRVTAESDEDGPWTIDGLWGLVWEGGYDQVGDIVQIDGEKVLRVYEPVTGGLTPGELVRLDSYVFPEDPTRGLGILFETVSYSSPLGDFEAWLVDGSSDTWAIFVHGRTGTRRETLRMLPSFLEAGLPTLVITFRNDAGAHADPSGYYRFGQTEWIDLESAAKYAIERGAEDLILVGYSMGGGTVTNFLYQSDLANEVVGVILDAPMTNFNATVDLGAEERGLPGPPRRVRQVPRQAPFRHRLGEAGLSRTSGRAVSARSSIPRRQGRHRSCRDERRPGQGSAGYRELPPFRGCLSRDVMERRPRQV